MKKIIIFGCGGHAKIVRDCIIDEKKYTILGFVDDKNYNQSSSWNVKYLGSIKNLSSILKKEKSKNLFGIVAVGSNIVRKKIVNQVEKINRKFQWANVIHPSSVIFKSVKIGHGNMFLAGSIICSNTKIKNHVSINTGSFIDHDNIFSDYSSTGPGAATGGKVKIGKGSFLGIGAAVKDNIEIGENTIIGGQSFICKNCKSHSLYYGVPAKRIKSRKEYEDYL